MFLRTYVRRLLAASLVLTLGATAELVQAEPTSESLTSTVPRISEAASGLQRAQRLDPPDAPPTPQGVAASLESLNRVRAQAGLTPLRLDPDLAEIALGWSTEMSRTGFRHSGGPYGENIAWTSDAGLSPDAAAALFNDMWVRSPGHYANMTNPRYTRIGIGLYRTPSGWWATHVFL